MALLAFLPLGTVWATSDLSALGSPDISISPASGPPGTRITITVSNIPDISNESYPYPDLYIYLPFSSSFGVTPQSQCGGGDCFPIYTHDQAVNHDFADRTVTFSLFSTANPSPVYLNAFENSVCDVTVNGKTIERYSTLCNTKDQPPGTYDIKFGWAEENAPQINYIVKSIQFTVTPAAAVPQSQKVDNGNSIIEAYQNGQISESEFYSRLAALGWNSEQIREALATIGKLPHQMGAPVPGEMQQIQQGVQKEAQSFVQESPQAPQQSMPQAKQVTEAQTADSFTPFKSVPQSTIPASQAGDSTAKDPQGNPWLMMTIAASVGAASAIGGGIVLARRTRKVTN